MKPARILLLVCLILCAALSAFSGATNGAPAKHPLKPHVTAMTQSFGETGPRIWLAEAKRVPAAHVAARPSAQFAAGMLASGQGTPLAMAHGDFDGDGVEDLVVGYATLGGGAIVLHRGNLDAFAPQSRASFEAIGRGEFPAPFLPTAQVYDVPVEPDFIAAGDFTGHGELDLAVAARGGNALYILPGDGKGHFGLAQAAGLPGAVTALAEGQFGSGPSAELLVGLSQGNHFSLAVLANWQQGLQMLGSYAVPGAVSSIELGNFGDAGPDAAFVAGGEVMILRSSPMEVTRVGVGMHAAALALGSFIFDRNGGSQIAVLATDGSVHIVARNEFDPRPFTTEEFQSIRKARMQNQVPELLPARTFPTDGWRVVESFPSTGGVDARHAPVFFRTRVSSNGADGIVRLTPAGQMIVIEHPNAQPDASTFAPGVISTRAYSGSSVAAMAVRTNVDGRPGVIALHAGQVGPSVTMPIPDPTFTVNTTSDGVFPGACAANTANECTLREAILESNGDTVMVPAGTYTLTIAKVVNDCTGKFGALSAERSVTIVGAGQNTTIIQAGTVAYNQGTANGVDMVMNVNEDLGTTNCPVTSASASLSNLTLQNGHNRGTHGNDGDGGCMEFDTGTNGTATLTLTDVTLQDCDTTQGNGGGLANFNFEVTTGTGQATISNSIIQGNSVTDTSTPGPNTAGGGGIWVSDPSRITMTNSQVLNNLATQTSGGTGPGGGIFLVSKGTPGETPQTQIHSSTISGNQSSSQGGGINDSGANLLVDTSTVITGNKNGQNGGGTLNGGGLFINPAADNSVTLTNVTITGNTSTGTGGGIATGAIGAGPVTISFSRLTGNTAGTTGSNLENLGSTDTVTDNWWGTNSASSTIHTTTGTTTFDPFIVLSNTASPVTIRINQSATVTADMSKDNHGSGTTLSGNLNEIAGLPVTFNNAVLGTIPQAQPETLNSSAQATATYNAGGTGGNGSVDATVDQQTVTASIVVLQPPSMTKNFNPTTVTTNTAATTIFSVTNGNTVAIDASFTDTLPSGLVVASTPSVVNGCGGTVTATAGSGSITFSNSALAAGTCSIHVNVQSAVDGTYINSATVDSTIAGNAATAATATLTVINPPTIAKAFGAANVPLNGTTSLTFTISNSNTNLTLNGIAFTDSLPAGLVVATPSSLNSTCSGTATAAAGGSSVALSGAALASGSSCGVSVNIQGTTPGVKNNSVQATSTNGGTGNTSNASVTVAEPPTIIKSFGAPSIPLNGTTSLNFTIQNLNSTQSLSGVAFADTLPAGLVVSTPNGVTGTCGSGTITATAGGNSVTLSGGTIAASGSCAFSVNMTGTTAGQKNNTTGQVTSVEGGTGGTASASITVVAPPSIAKVFNPTTITLNGTSTLTFTLTNPAANTVAEAGVAFTDTLPTGLVVSTPNGLTNSCGGTAVATAGGTSISLTGGSIGVNTSCTVVVNVTGAASGQYTNTTGNVTSTNGGTGNTATAALSVANPPTVSNAFGALTIPLNGTTSLTFSITNPNSTVALSGLAFTDSLPAGLVVASTSNINNTCGGTVTAPAGASAVVLSGGTLAASSTCAVSVSIQGTSAGVKNDSVSVTDTQTGASAPANATITVDAPPAITKAFGAATIPLDGSTSLSFTIQNPNSTSTLSGVGFTDSLPAGLVISTPNGLTGSSCGGTISAAQGTNLISLSGGSLAASGSCTFSINIVGSTAGAKNNTTGNVTSNEGGVGGTASASLSVTAPPSIAKAFNPATIAPNATTSLTFTITNPASNAVALTGVAFTDTLPTGLTVNSATATVCGGTLTTTAPTGIALSGATVGVNSQCQFSVTVTGAVPGNYTNTTSTVSSTNGGTGNSASAPLSVGNPPAITKAFGASSIGLGRSASLTFTITNANSALALTGIAFNDPLPAGLLVSTPNGLTGTCGAGAITAVAGSSAVGLSGGNIPASGSCTFSVNVTAVAAGTQVNTTGNVTSTNAGAGNSATASITVLAPDLTLSKSHTGNFFQGEAGAVYSLVVSNSGAGPTAGSVTVTEAPPSGITVTAMVGNGWSCNLTALSCTRSDALATGSSYPAIMVTVTVAANAPASVINSAAVSGGGELNLADDAASDTTTITAPLDFTISATPTTATVQAGQPATYTLTITSQNNTFTNAISLAAIGLPGNSQATFNPSSVTLGSTGAGSTLTISTSPGDPFVAQTLPAKPLYGMLLPLLGVVFSLGFRRKFRTRQLAFLLLFFLLFNCGLFLMGCAAAGNFRKLGTPPGTYNITVIATSGTTQHSVPVTLVVHSGS